MFKHKHIMTSKTITVREEAYIALKSLKLKDESFSETILRISKLFCNLESSWGSGVLSKEEYEEELDTIVKKRQNFFEGRK